MNCFNTIGNGICVKNVEDLSLNGWKITDTYWTANVSGTISVIVVGGGGNGGAGVSNGGGGGGGGAGGYLETTATVTRGNTYQIKIGLKSTITSAVSESTTIFGNFSTPIIAYGGGYGGRATTNATATSGLGNGENGDSSNGIRTGGLGGKGEPAPKTGGVGGYGANGSGGGGGGGGDRNSNIVKYSAGGRGGTSTRLTPTFPPSASIVSNYIRAGAGGKSWAAGSSAWGGSGGGNGTSGSGAGTAGQGGSGIIVLTHNNISIAFKY